MVFSERKFQQGLGRYVFQLFRNKQLNVIVGCISNIHMAKTIHVNTFRLGKLPVSFSFTAPFCYKSAVACEFLYICIVSVINKDISLGVYSHTMWMSELPVSSSMSAPFG